MNHKIQLTRRQTLKGLAALATVQIVPSRLLGLNGQTPPSEEITKGIIGCGGISKSHLTMPGRLLALCDVDTKHLATRFQGAGGKEAGIKTYGDFRELLQQKDIDIVHICTPPHWHALMSIAAAKAGKDVFCEKPMTHTIGGGLAVRKAMKEYKKIFRINTWFRFKGGFYGMRTPVQMIKKAIDADMFGWPLTFHVGAKTGFNWKLNLWVGKTGLKEEPVPPELDYDLWLGPAPKKPYNKLRVHNNFRGYWDYDGGGLGDMGQHYLDPIQYMLNKDDECPISVEIDADPQDDDAIGTWRRIEFTYADGCKVILDGGDGEPDGVTPYLEGPKGKLFPKFESDIPDFRKKVASLPDPAPQNTDFLECVRERKPFALNEDTSFWSCSMVNMGVIAHRLNKNLKFDPKALRFDDKRANELMINPAMRNPWKL